ncbi:MAG: serine hydrolase [Bacteroidetes bacterium]|nr:serine hydrolase [Bacteroidota bacterium]
MKRIFWLIIPLLLLCNFINAQTPAFISDSLENYIHQGMKDWAIPGLAVAVIKDGKTVVMKGFGVRDMQSNEPVDENTLFMIASNSKLFTATALAQLEYHQKLSLDDKISKYFPGYSVYDPITTQLVTIRDMLSHHLGTRTFQGDFAFWDSKLSSAQIMNKMKLLKTSQNFRQSFGYCNSCFLTAGEVIPVVTGKPWAVYIYDSLLLPLGMDNTHALGLNMGNMENASKPYTNLYTGKLTELPYDRVDNLAPAGSIVSNIKDMAKWLTMQLDSGKLNGKQIVPWQAIQRTRDMQTIISSRKSFNRPTHFTGYGLGVFETDYAGKQIFWHTGGAMGFVTNTCFVPEDHLAIVILTNMDNQSFFEDLRYQILDAYLGRPFKNYSKMDLAASKPDFEKSIADVKAMQDRIKGEKPALNLNDYNGTYENELYGSLQISKKGDELEIQFNNTYNLTASLQYMDHGQWLLTYSNIDFGILPIHFNIENNKVVSIEIRVNEFLDYDPYIFIKK